jgi:hypothetical protein
VYLCDVAVDTLSGLSALRPAYAQRLLNSISTEYVLACHVMTAFVTINVWKIENTLTLSHTHARTCSLTLAHTLWLLLPTGAFLLTIRCSARRSVPRIVRLCGPTKAPSRAFRYCGQCSLAAAPSAATTPVRRSCAQALAPRKMVYWTLTIGVSHRCRPMPSKACHR